MDPVTLVLVPGILGGLAIAWLIAGLHGRGPKTLPVPSELSISTDVINIAHIRAAGLGGLGLFAMAVVVAVFVPGIRLAVGVGLLSGAALGVVLILRRRRTGPLPSSGGSAGANVVLSIDHPAASNNDEPRTTGQSDAPTLKAAAGVA
jgi:hypothetical protein